LSGCVDDLHVVSVFQFDLGGQASGAFDAIALNHDRLVPSRSSAVAVYQGSIRDHDGLFTNGAHERLL
jgi:hypothetical protein